MSMKESRREFLKKSSMVIGGAAVLGGTALFTGCAKEEKKVDAVEEQKPLEIPAHPYEYKELDLDRVEKLAYEGYFEKGCCYGVAKALLTELKDKVGFPMDAIPMEMFTNGKEGYGCGSLCGALGGAAGVIGIVCSPDDSKKVLGDLTKWYTSTALPIYQPEEAAPVQTVSTSVNCADSVSIFMKAANVERADMIRKRRCGGLSGDVARKTAELLNVLYGFAEAAPVVDETPAEDTLAPNEYIGEAEGFGGPIKVKVTMDGDKISKIDVLSHNETAGVSNPAFDTIPNAIISAQSTDVDVAAGASLSSKGIMDAVNDALSKVGKN